MEIQVVRQRSVVRAQVRVDGGRISEFGEDADQAIGRLIRLHGEGFGVNLTWLEGGTPGTKPRSHQYPGASEGGGDMSKHTPGPWEVDDCGNVIVDGAALAQVFGADDFPCLPEETHDEVTVECCANARLIAAAPDLLAACERAETLLAGLRRDLADLRAVHCRNVLDTVRAAIAKAKG